MGADGGRGKYNLYRDDIAAPGSLLVRGTLDRVSIPEGIFLAARRLCLRRWGARRKAT